jgi:hypothetical protein
MKSRILALMMILAVTFTAAPAFAGHRYIPRHEVHRHVWTVPFAAPPRRYYRPPVYVPPLYHPDYYVPSPSYWVPGRDYYEPSWDVGVGRSGFGLHIEF